jgi:uncharacterized membrane-anchored protein YitT (DUF2179 family)
LSPNFISYIKDLFLPKGSRTEESIRKRKAARQFRFGFFHSLRDAFVILLGIISAGFGLKGFLIPNGFIDGGVMGISLLANQETKISLSVLIVVFNLPFLLLAYSQISRALSFKSIISITVLAVVVAFIPYPTVTNDKILISVFGGFFLGAGIGLSIRGGAVIDGTEVLAIYLNRKSALSVGDFILLFNILIFGVASYLLGIEVALYSILTYLAASKTIDFILEGIEEFTSVTIISSRSRPIKELIQNGLGHGITVYAGRKGFGKSGESDQEIDIIFTVITRLEVNRLKTEVEKIDPRAFIFMNSIRDTHGGLVKKKPIKKVH